MDDLVVCERDCRALAAPIGFFAALFAQLCPSEWASVNGTLFFVTQKNDYTVELWRSDGTSSGTTLIRMIP